MRAADVLVQGREIQRERALALIDQKGQDAYDSLSDPERVWFTVTRLLFCIRDGGLPSYFYNGYAEHLADCLRSLELLGAAEMHGLLRRESRRFRNGKPTLLATLGGFLSSANSQAKESEREQDLANSVEARLNSYVAQHRLA